MTDFPQLLHTVLDARDVRREAEFWRELLGLVYRPGDEVPDGADDADWLVLTQPDGRRCLAIQEVESLPWQPVAGARAPVGVPPRHHGAVPGRARRRPRAGPPARSASCASTDRTTPTSRCGRTPVPPATSFCVFVA